MLQFLVSVVMFILEKTKCGLSKGKLGENLIMVSGTNVGKKSCQPKPPTPKPCYEQLSGHNLIMRD